MNHKQLLGIGLFALTFSAALVQEKLKVKPNKENVVASRIDGVWMLDEDLTRRFGGSMEIKQIAFVPDESVAAKIPEQHRDMFAADIFHSGSVQINAETFPYVLTTMNGNPCVVYFRAGQGDPMWAADMLNVMLAPSMERPKDLLLVGADKNNQPFRAFKRKELAPKKG